MANIEDRTGKISPVIPALMLLTIPRGIFPVASVRCRGSYVLLETIHIYLLIQICLDHLDQGGGKDSEVSCTFPSYEYFGGTDGSFLALFCSDASLL